jgi:hypothetical protein
MAAKFSKYIITSNVIPQQKNAWSPAYRPQDRTQLVRLDDAIVEGAKMYAHSAWFWPAMMETKPSERATKPHTHDYNEVLGLIGTNTDDPHDLCGESEITIGGEKHIVNKSCLIYLPAGLEHGPFKQVRISKPIIHFEFRSSGRHA